MKVIWNKSALLLSPKQMSPSSLCISVNAHLIYKIFWLVYLMQNFIAIKYQEKIFIPIFNLPIFVF